MAQQITSKQGRRPAAGLASASYRRGGRALSRRSTRSSGSETTRAGARVPPRGQGGLRGAAYLELGGKLGRVFARPERAHQRRQVLGDLRAARGGPVAAERQELGQQVGVAETLHHGVHETGVAVVLQTQRARGPRPVAGVELG